MLHVLILALLAQSPAVTQPSVSKEPDACSLVSDADVRTSLGVTVKERRPGTQQAQGLLLSQCYLGTGTARSVSIAIAGSTRSGGKIVTPRAIWHDQFHRRDKRDPELQPGDREQEGESKARPITGVGDEAFWSGTRVAGALYVLRGNTFIRLSVGGISDEKERIEKTRQLAVTALTRLQ